MTAAKKIIRNRCANRSNVIGSAVVTLDGTVDGHRPIEAAFDDGDTVRYTVVEPGEGDVAWEEIEGVLVTGTPPHLTRAKSLDSSSPSGDPIAFSTATGKLVFVDAGAALVAAERGRLNIATTTGTLTGGKCTAYELDLPVPPQQLKDGVEVWFFVHAPNGDPGAGNFHTLKVNDQDPKPIKAGIPRRRIAFGAMATDALVGCKYSEAGTCWVPIAGLVRVVKTITTTPYPVVEEDHEQILVFNSAAAIAVTVSEATGQFAEPFSFDYLNAGAGTVTFTPTTSTINTAATIDAETGQGGRWFAEAGNYRSTQVQAAKVPASVRQTVLSGPVDANGLPNFGGATGGTALTAAATLLLAAATGFDADGGQIDVLGSIENPQWTGLNTNGKHYLYLDIAADGTCTPGHSTLAPIYQFGGTYSTTNDQFTFDFQEMIGKVGTGSAANQTARVFVGQVQVSSGVIAGITWYALRGQYYSAGVTPTNATTHVVNHNIGAAQLQIVAVFECQSADVGFAVGDRFQLGDTYEGGGTARGATLGNDRVAAWMTIGNTGFYIFPKGGTTADQPTLGNWKLKFEIRRAW
jgi:hypothetical protein